MRAAMPFHARRHLRRAARPPGAADIDRLLIQRGERLGENDNWIAGFAAYYRETVLSRDADFDRAPGVRRIAY